MRRLGEERGQTSTEYLGVLLLIAVVAATLVASGLGGTLAGGVERAICLVSQSESCGAGAEGEEPPAGGTAADPPPTPEELVDGYMEGELEDFLAERDSPTRDERLDWSTDGCSAPLVGSTGRSFDFTDACLRHDFGYRNYKDLGLFEERKAAVDERFLQDMKDHCATRNFVDERFCLNWAYIFYEGVDRFG